MRLHRILASALGILTCISAQAQTGSFRVVSGASYQAAIAPNSWAVLLGSGLAQTTAIATLDENGEWPKVLANTSVQVNGQDARLFYVSAGQINILVPD